VFCISDIAHLMKLIVLVFVFRIFGLTKFLKCGVLRKIDLQVFLIKFPKITCRVIKVCFEFELNSCNVIFISQKIILMKIFGTLIYLNRIIVDDPQ